MDFSTVGTKNFLQFLGGPTQKLLLVPLVLKIFGDFSEDPPKKSEILTVFQNVASDSDAILTAGGENICSRAARNPKCFRGTYSRQFSSSGRY